MARVGFEPMIPVSERAETVHALDRAATVIGLRIFTTFYFQYIPGIHSLVGNSGMLTQDLFSIRLHT
jgi:hypothetical protein